MITVYSAIYNNYDDLLAFPEQDIDCQFILFTDRPYYSAQRKMNIYHSEEFDQVSDNLKARYIKTHSHILDWVKDWLSLWIDGNTIIKSPSTVRKIVENYKERILCFKHFERENVLEEMERLQSLEKFSWEKDKIEIQKKRYIADWYKFDNGLSCSGVMLRDNSRQTEEFNEMRRKEISENSVRDQVSMHYCAWKLWMIIDYFPREYPKNEYIWYRRHVHLLLKE